VIGFLKRLALVFYACIQRISHPKAPQLTRISCAKSSWLFFQNCPIFSKEFFGNYGNILSYHLLYSNTPTPQKKTKRQDCHWTYKWPKKHITCKNNLISKNVQTILPYMMYTWKFLLICRNRLQLARQLFNCQRFTCGTEAIRKRIAIIVTLKQFLLQILTKSGKWITQWRIRFIHMF